LARRYRRQVLRIPKRQGLRWRTRTIQKSSIIDKSQHNRHHPTKWESKALNLIPSIILAANHGEKDLGFASP